MYYFQNKLHFGNTIRIFGQILGPIARVLEGVGSWGFFSTLRLSILSRRAPKPARNSNSLKSYRWLKPYHQKRTNPTVARERGTVAGRDQKCREALVDLYNILEYQKDRPNGCTQRGVPRVSHYGRGCKIRISRRTPDFQASSLLVHPSPYALVGG